MATSVQFRPQNRDLGMVMREVDEDLAIFLGIGNVEMEKNDSFLAQESDHFDESLKCAEGDESFLNLEMERSDHDWLLKQPDPSLQPTLDAKVQDSAISNGEDTILKSELEKASETSASLSESSSPLASVECCTTVTKRPPSPEGRKPARRAATPTGRQPTKPSRASTPTSRAALLPSSKPAAAQARSSTPVRASRPVVSKSGPRSATPTRKPATPSTASAAGPSRGGSAAVKSRPSKPSDTLSLSQEAHQNQKVSMPRRPASASRGRAASHSNEKPRQKSCSPSKARAPPKTGSHVLSRSRGRNDVGDEVNPVVMGTKMVERVVNMRKLAPPKQDEYVSQENPRRSSQENSGFGRSLSKKSLEMAIRHMDIRRSVPDRSRTSTAKSSTSAAPKSPAAAAEAPIFSMGEG